MDGYAVEDVINGAPASFGWDFSYPWPTMASYFMLSISVSFGKNSHIDHTEEDPLAHAQHPIDLLDTEPMKDIGHQGLKAHVLDASHVFGSLEIIRSPVFSTFSCIVDDCGECVSISHGKGNV